MNHTRATTKSRALANRTRAKRIPRLAREAFLFMQAHTRQAIRVVIRFAVRHSALIENLVIGAIVACLLAQIPYIGAFLATIALAAAAGAGLLIDLLRQIDTACTNN